ncbi:MAG: NAD(P)-binding protein, partial [Candidatus Kapaibacterium sp.]
MGFKSFTIKMPTDYTDETLRNKIKKTISSEEFEYSIDKKSLDGRQKTNIHWLLQISVSSKSIKDGEEPDAQTLEIPEVNTNKTAIVVGSGPAGFYSAYVLRRAGFRVRLIEQGPEVFQRIKDVKLFHKKRILNERSNYAFGEGGAGTFSDGKLTSRTKSIKLERNFIFNEYIEAGAPEEIRYLSKPHIGSNLLVKTAKNLRLKFLELGGEMLFDTEMIDVNLNNGKVTS